MQQMPQITPRPRALGGTTANRFCMPERTHFPSLLPAGGHLYHQRGLDSGSCVHPSIVCTSSKCWAPRLQAVGTSFSSRTLLCSAVQEGRINSVVHAKSTSKCRARSHSCLPSILCVGINDGLAHALQAPRNIGVQHSSMDPPLLQRRKNVLSLSSWSIRSWSQVEEQLTAESHDG